MKHIPLLPTKGTSDSQLVPHEFCAFAASNQPFFFMFSALAFGFVKARSLPQDFCPGVGRDEECKRQQL